MESISEKKIFDLPDELSLSVAFLRGVKGLSARNEQELTKIAEEAILIGAEHAEKFKGFDIEKVAASRKIKLTMVRGGIIGNKLIRANYDHSIKTITTYEDGVLSILSTPAAEMLGIPNTTEAIRELLMWHEFFHVLEFTEIGLVGEKFKFPAKTLWFTKDKPVYAVSEVSANAFAMRVVGLNYSPFLIDYLLHNEKLWKEEVTNDENN